MLRESSAAAGPVPAALRLFTLDISRCPTLAALRTIRAAAAAAATGSSSAELASLLSPRSLCAAAAASLASSGGDGNQGNNRHTTGSVLAAASAASAACGRIITGLRPPRPEGKVRAYSDYRSLCSSRVIIMLRAAFHHASNDHRRTIISNDLTLVKVTSKTMTQAVLSTAESEPSLLEPFLTFDFL